MPGFRLPTTFLVFPRGRQLLRNKYPWEVAKLGINTPPIKTPYGWLTLYHAVERTNIIDWEQCCSTRKSGLVLHRTPDWLMEPEADYEIDGFYRGVCFPCGTVVINDTLFVYYGGGDKYFALATCPLVAMLDHLRSSALVFELRLGAKKRTTRYHAWCISRTYILLIGRPCTLSI